MKKLLLPLILIFILITSACSHNSSDKKASTSKMDDQPKTFTYQSETGPVEVPTHPKRVILLSGFTGNVISLGVNVVGVDVWSKNNPTFKNLEKIIELKPDLIIGLSNIKNIDKLKEIAPTVTYTCSKLDYLAQHIEIGKLLNKEKEATKWVDDFKQRAEKAGDEIRAKIGEDATVSVFESYDKQLYVGNNWARGTEILYQVMKLKMPEKVKEVALKDGYYTLSTEVLHNMQEITLF